jgi:hypothetical protein
MLNNGFLYKASLPLLAMLRRAQAQPCGWIAWTYRATIGEYLHNSISPSATARDNAKLFSLA